MVHLGLPSHAHRRHHAHGYCYDWQDAFVGVRVVQDRRGAQGVHRSGSESGGECDAVLWGSLFSGSSSVQFTFTDAFLFRWVLCVVSRPFQLSGVCATRINDGNKVSLADRFVRVFWAGPEPARRIGGQVLTAHQTREDVTSSSRARWRRLLFSRPSGDWLESLRHIWAELSEGDISGHLEHCGLWSLRGSPRVEWSPSVARASSLFRSRGRGASRCSPPRAAHAPTLFVLAYDGFVSLGFVVPGFAFVLLFDETFQGCRLDGLQRLQRIARPLCRSIAIFHSGLAPF